jgi:hypothetical protein
VQAQGSLACGAVYASLFEPGVARMDLWQLPTSHAAGPDYLNVLRVLDVPQAVAMASERCKVSLHQADAQGWEYPAAVARKLGWAK